MRLDGAHAEEELRGDLGVRVAERDQPQDLHLALGEVVRRPGGLRRRRGDARAELGREEGAARRGDADGLDELVVGGLLEHVGARAGLERLARERGVLLHGQHHHAGRRRLLQEERESPAGSGRPAC